MSTYQDLTNIEHFDSPESFIRLLTVMRVEDNERNHLTVDGFTRLRDIVEYFERSSGSQIKKYFEKVNSTFGSSPPTRRVYFPPRIIQHLSGIVWYYTHCVYTFHVIPSLTHINVSRATSLGMQLEDIIDPSSEDKTTTKGDDDIQLPKLKGGNTWIEFRDKMVLKISKMKNRRLVSLEYLIDESERPVNRANANLMVVTEMDLSDSEIFRTQAVHFGSIYKIDNRRLWDLLESTLVNTSPYNHISPFERTKDGRKGWFALKRHYEGEDYIRKTQNQAMYALSNTFYRGDSKNYRFEDYINSHLNAHKKLLQIGFNSGNGLDESTKIHYFKQNILPSADLETALTLARVRETESFAEYYTFLSTEVDFKLTRKRMAIKGAKERNVSSLEGTDDESRKLIKGKGFNRFGPMLTEMCEGKRLESKIYSKSEFSRLSKRQKAVVVKLNKQRRLNSRGRHKGVKSTGANSSVISSIRSDLNSLGEAIVADVTRAVKSSDDQSIATPSVLTPNTMSPNGNQAQSGGVGDFIAQARKRRKSN